MTHGGYCLDDWIDRVHSTTNRIGFMCEMLRQVLPALARIH